MPLSKGESTPIHEFGFLIKSICISFRRDKPEYPDLFVREASIVGDTRDKKLFLSDLCKFDIIRSKFFTLVALKTTLLHRFSANRGVEAVNVSVVDRAVKSISQLPKIRKRKPSDDQNQVSINLFKSTV